MYIMDLKCMRLECAINKRGTNTGSSFIAFAYRNYLYLLCLISKSKVRLE